MAALLAGVIFAGLYFSYSQSSLVVLFATVLVVSLVLADRLSRNIVIGIAVAMVIAGGAMAAIEVSEHGIGRATSGRTRLVSVTGHVIANHPVAGVGIGSQPLAAKEELDTRRRASKNASHTTPLTVLAELGAVGFLLYLAFLAGAVRLLWEAFRRDRVFGLGLGVCFLVLFLHSLFYSGFFEDPVMWGVLGVATMLVARRRAAAPPHDPRRVAARPSRAAGTLRRAQLMRRRFLLALGGAAVVLAAGLVGAWLLILEPSEPTGLDRHRPRGRDGHRTGQAEEAEEAETAGGEARGAVLGGVRRRSSALALTRPHPARKADTSRSGRGRWAATWSIRRATATGRST